MIFLDTDVWIDVLRRHPPAIEWLNALNADAELALSGYVLMELIQGCRNKDALDKVHNQLTPYPVVWPAPDGCDRALEIFVQYRLSHNAGLLDALIGQTAVELNAPLCTFNAKHYGFIPHMRTVQPYERDVTPKP